MLPFAKIVIPFVVYYHPGPWLFLLLAAVVTAAVFRSFYGGLQSVDSLVGGCGAVFCYAGYHMVGGFLNDMDPCFGLGLVGVLGSVAVAAASLRANYYDSLRIDAEEPIRREQLRQDAVRNLVTNLGCSEQQAVDLLDRYDGDDVKALMEVRAGRAAGLPSAQVAVAAPLPAGERVEGSPFDPADGFVLLKVGPGPKDVGRMARLLSSVTTLNAVDAAQQLRSHRGAVILPNLKEAAAQAFMKALQQDGMAVVKMPVRDMLRFTFAGEAKALTYSDAGLQLLTTTEQTLLVPWEQMILLSIGLFNATAVPDIDGLVDARKGILCADLFILQGEDQCVQFAIDARKLTYAHLGSRMETSAWTNFRLTISDIVERAPRLLKNDSVDALLQRSMAKSFRTPEDFAGESSGMLQLVQAARLSARPN